MENSVIKFDPTEVELKKMAVEYGGLVVKDIDDKVGLKEVSEGRKYLGKVRGKITKAGKDQRDDALKFQREVIKKEKFLIGLILPTEDKLKEIEDNITKEKARIKQEKEQEKQILIQKRMGLLGEIGKTKFDIIELQEMSDDVFNKYYEYEKSIYDEEFKLKKEFEDRLNEGRLKLEKDKTAFNEKQRIENQKILDEQEIIEKEKLKIQKKKDDIIKIEEAKKKAIELENKRKEDEEKAKQEQIKQNERKKRCKEFLEKYDGQYDNRFETDKGFILYKKVAEFIY